MEILVKMTLVFVFFFSPNPLFGGGPRGALSFFFINCYVILHIPCIKNCFAGRDKRGDLEALLGLLLRV